MKKFLGASAVALSLVLSACSSTGTLDPAAIATAAQAACGFLPLVTSVTSVLNANNSIKDVESAVALICGSFKTQVASGKLGSSVADKQVTIEVNTGNGKLVPVTGSVK